MNKNYITTLLVLIVCLTLKAQTSLDLLFESVLKNNNTIKSYGLYTNWQKQSAKVGLTPDNPEFEFGYFPGNSDAIGTKQIISISQSFSFPTTYIHKKKLANQKLDLINTDIRKNSQQILLNAWQCWVKAIYLQKTTNVLELRKSQAHRLLNNYIKKQKNGDATQLEVNKAKLFLLDIENRVRIQNGLIQQNNEELKMLNGGLPIEITDTAYINAQIINWDKFAEKIKTEHTEFVKAKQSLVFANQNLKMSKAAWLPSLILGYESESILGDTYSGIKAGISIPLWKQKGKISTGKALIAYTEQQNTELNQTLLMAYKKKYIEVSVLLDNLNAFRESLSQMNNTYLLSRSLELGQISAIEYFIELDYFYEISDKLLELELEYQLNFAQLFDFTLM